MSESREIEGVIQKLRCTACGASFPHLLFHGEQDTDTAGLCSAAACGQSDLAVAVEADPFEWKQLTDGNAASLERRLLGQTRLGPIRVIRLARVERKELPPGMSLIAYREAYEPLTLIYSCICCGADESRVMEEVEIDEFVKSGGRLVLTGRLVLNRSHLQV